MRNKPNSYKGKSHLQAISFFRESQAKQLPENFSSNKPSKLRTREITADQKILLLLLTTCLIMTPVVEAYSRSGAHNHDNADNGERTDLDAYKKPATELAEHLITHTAAHHFFGNAGGFLTGLLHTSTLNEEEDFSPENIRRTDEALKRKYGQDDEGNPNRPWRP